MRGYIKKEKNGTYTYCVYVGTDTEGKKNIKEKGGLRHEKNAKPH